MRHPGIAGGRPIIEGTRVRVEFVVGQLRAGDEPWDVIAAFPNLTPAAVYDAISYYFDHKDEIDRSLAETEALADRHRSTVGTTHNGDLKPE